MNHLPHSTVKTMSPIRTSADLTAYVVHSLGYWPEHSIVFLATTPGGIGPCLRADWVQDITADEKHDFLTEILQMIPTQDRDGETLNSIFCLIFGETGTTDAHNIHSGQSWQPELELIQQDALATGRAQEWVSSTYTAIEKSPFDLTCMLFINTYTRWHTNDPAAEFSFDGFVEDIVLSDHYSEQVFSGSTPSKTLQEHAERQYWNVDASRDAPTANSWHDDAVFWAQSYRAMTSNSESYCLNYTAQKTAEFTLWDDAITTIENICHPDNRSALDTHWADKIRSALPAEVAGYLASTLTTMGSSQLVMGVACVGLSTVTRSLAELDHLATPVGAVSTAPVPLLLPKSTMRAVQPNQEPSTNSVDSGTQVGATLENALDTIASYLMGTTPQAPPWLRLEALEILLHLVRGICTPDVMGRVLALLGWIHWLRGSSSQAHTLLMSSRDHQETPEFIAFEEAINHNFLPLWCTSGEQAWRGREFDLPN
ncbi:MULTISPECIES: DUF4192 family protein [unclassified Rothia (in: high G+C Gram-positive bacteria)]|uniref:DUF4192 family protein n=1 Tax=unclassified Rothia (in: high G+C Gram-positive bacteria) TaxID=2689056 RepID=UPI001956F09A|nr:MULTISPECIES: DUF4192 family protein [unclassified Rothia (in: high G+C Gram-positive bacteria)]MBM7050717.1 DUF4192 family protein [Rothia sp. ZJ1223]QRZ60902.1 DUF4192 family protein [Rothia sp. ZJ932]